jgi:hypothetical protein
LRFDVETAAANAQPTREMLFEAVAGTVVARILANDQLVVMQLDRGAAS